MTLLARTVVRHEVPSDTDPDVTYVVDVLGDHAICNCPGFRVSKAGACKHTRRIQEMTTETEQPTADADETEMTRALAPLEVRPPATTLPTMSEVSVMVALASRVGKAAGAVPSNIKNADQAMAVFLAGWELGLRPMTSLREMYIVNGRVQPMARAMMGVVRARDPSARFVFHKTDAEGADVEWFRGGKTVIRLAYTKAEAEKSGQLKKEGPWQSYPTDMYRWAAVRRVCQLGAPDLINAIATVAVGDASVADMEEAGTLPPADPAEVEAEWKSAEDAINPPVSDSDIISETVQKLTDMQLEKPHMRRRYLGLTDEHPKGEAVVVWCDLAVAEGLTITQACELAAGYADEVIREARKAQKANDADPVGQALAAVEPLKRLMAFAHPEGEPAGDGGEEPPDDGQPPLG